MIQPIIEKSYTVEVNLGTVAEQKQINFQFIPQLEGTTIYAVQAFCFTDVAKSPSGANTVIEAGLSSLAVTFSVGDNQDVYLMPVYDLRPGNIYGFTRMFNNKRFSLTKSFVTILATTNLSNNQAVVFNFLYR